MNQEIADALGRLAANTIQRNLEENEDWNNLISVLGKAVFEPETATAQEPEKPTLNEIQSLKFTEQSSSKGKYRLVSKEENANNLVFGKLQNYLNSKSGFAQIHGFKAWIFSNNPNKIGLRKL